jgi:hypothetical protein
MLAMLFCSSMLAILHLCLAQSSMIPNLSSSSMPAQHSSGSEHPYAFLCRNGKA